MTADGPIQMMAQFKRATGTTIHLKPFQRLLKVMVSDAAVVVQIETFTVKETARQVTFSARGVIMMAYTQNAHGYWCLNDDLVMTMWDEDFTPTTTLLYNNLETVIDTDSKRAWERECYRPGGDVESYSVSSQSAPESVRGMTKYWNK